MDASNPTPSPRCREGHHRFNELGLCTRPGCPRAKKDPPKDAATVPTLKIVKDLPPRIDEKAAQKANAIAKLKGVTVADTDLITDTADTSDPDAIHLADLASPGIIELETIAAKYVSKRIFRREILEVTSDDKAPPTEALRKWIKKRWPKVSTTPFGEMVMSQLLFVAVLQLKSKPLPPKQPTPVHASTASHTTKPDRDTVQRVDMPSANNQTERTTAPTPREL